MKYIAVLDTDEIEDFAFFQDGKEKYVHGIDANSVNGEWIYLPFKPLEQEPKIIPVAEIKYDEDKLKELVDKAVLTVTPQEPILDKLRSEITALQNRCYSLTKGVMCGFCKYECQYKAETEET
jgi:hypothetical protein